MIVHESTYQQLADRVITVVCHGRHRILLWGVTEATTYLVARLRVLGLESAIAGVVDQRSQLDGTDFWEWRVLAPKSIGQLVFDAVFFGFDQEKEDVLRLFLEHGNSVPQAFIFGVENYEFRDPVFYKLVESSYVRSHAGGYPAMLTHLYQCLRILVSRGARGDVAEFGVYKGGTTTFLARCLLELGHDGKVYGFDTFDGFPPPLTILDTHDASSDEFADEEPVKAQCELFPNIELVKGDISETYLLLRDRALILSFFDTDNYSATREALPLCVRQTVPGGVIAFDHYYSPSWPTTLGERVAANEVLDGSDWLNLHGTGIFLKAA